MVINSLIDYQFVIRLYTFDRTCLSSFSCFDIFLSSPYVLFNSLLTASPRFNATLQMFTTSVNCLQTSSLHSSHHFCPRYQHVISDCHILSVQYSNNDTVQYLIFFIMVLSQLGDSDMQGVPSFSAVIFHHFSMTKNYAYIGTELAIVSDCWWQKIGRLLKVVDSCPLLWAIQCVVNRWFT